MAGRYVRCSAYAPFEREHRFLALLPPERLRRSSQRYPNLTESTILW